MHPEPYSVTDAARALRAGETTSVELVESAITLADRHDAALGVYLTRFDEQARRRARRADDELARGLDKGPLHGIPIAVKDVIAVADGPTTAQSLVHDPDWGAGRDAPVVARLKRAGAVITGKTTTMEFGCGIPDAEKPFPVPRNPWDPNRWAGGSSSGTANGIAAGLFPAGLGSDAAGSIRMPAAFCGITGLMPTFGLVPRSGCVPLGYTVGRVGPMARTARDCAALLAVIAGEHPADPDSAGTRFEPVPPATDDLTGLRVGVVRAEHFPPGSDPGLAGAFDHAVGVMAAAGACVEEVVLPYWREAITVTMISAYCEGLAYHRADLSERWDEYFAASRGLLARGALISGADYVQAQRVRRVAQAAIARLFERVDVVACPTAATGAPPLDKLANEAGHQDDEGSFGMIRTPYWNALGNPVLAVPIGLGAAGLPLSMQLAGPAFGDATILRAAEAYQLRTEWHRDLPPAFRTEVAR